MKNKYLSIAGVLLVLLALIGVFNRSFFFSNQGAGGLDSNSTGGDSSIHSSPPDQMDSNSVFPSITSSPSQGMVSNSVVKTVVPESRDREPSAGAVIRSALTPEVGGMRAQARVVVSGKDYDLKPNVIGKFPRILVPANGKVEISVTYPEGEPNDLLVLQAEDGGQIEEGGVVRRMTLDENRSVQFNFNTARAEGIYRVTLRNGVDEKRLDFWVGEETKLQKGTQGI